MKRKEKKVKALSLSLIGLQFFILSCSGNNSIAETGTKSNANQISTEIIKQEVIPTDEYYQKKEKEYAVFKNRFGDPLKGTLDKMPKETMKLIIEPEKLIKCFETKMPNLPGISGTLTRPNLSVGTHSIDATYHTRLSDQKHSSTQIYITIYQYYEQAKRFTVMDRAMAVQPDLLKPDKKMIGDYSWSNESATSAFFSSLILFTNLQILIFYQEGSEIPSDNSQIPVDNSKRKEEVCQAIIKLIEECQ